MSHYYGTVKGSRGEATRGGGKNSGIQTNTATWAGNIRTTILWDEEEGCDHATIWFTPWSGSVGASAILYKGTIQRLAHAAEENLVTPVFDHYELGL